MQYHRERKEASQTIHGHIALALPCRRIIKKTPQAFWPDQSEAEGNDGNAGPN
jgi:hypothetical protein